MKYLITIIVLLFPFSVSAAVGDISGGLENNTQVETTTKPQNVSGDLEQAFCDGYKLKNTGNKRYLTPYQNKLVVETFANTFGQDLQKEYERTAIQLSLERKQQTVAYNKLEELCLEYRGSSEERYNDIENLYKQVTFFNTYYDRYPDSLKQGIIPNFLIFLIDVVETVMFYIIWLSFFNIIFWIINYGISSPDKKIIAIDRIKLAIVYFLLVWAVSAGIVGGLITYVGYDNLELFKIFFNF